MSVPSYAQVILLFFVMFSFSFLGSGCSDGKAYSGQDIDVEAYIGVTEPISNGFSGTDDIGGDATGGGASGGGASGGHGSEGDATEGDGSELVTVWPLESDELFANPGMGWQTFHRFADNDPNLAGLPSGSAYFRFSWKTLEPTDGNIRLNLIADALNRARRAGQTLMFRVMTAGSDEGYTPEWLGSSGCELFTYDYGSNRNLRAPNLDHPVCWSLFDRLMRAIGEAFGQEPDIQVDIGGVGLWGEWHFSGTQPRVPMPTLETRKKVVDLHLTLFPNSPQMALIGDVDALSYATSKGSGWRADCLGDLGFFSDRWNHMDNLYRQNIQRAGAEEAWKHGPVAWESCYSMQEWVERGFDVHYIFQYALDLHGSFFNNKSKPIPAGEQIRAEIEWFLKRLGYRLVLRSLTHPQRTSPGGQLPIHIRWENVGVAPPYHPFKLKIRLVHLNNPSAEVVLVSNADVRTWLPGTVEVSDLFTLPSDMEPGAWQLSVGITGTPGFPMLNLAIIGRDPQGWYPVSSIVIE